MSSQDIEAPSSLAEVVVGRVLAGKYRIERILGRGGMGIVVAATHLELESMVAIKLLLPEVRSNEEVVARFSREARAAAKIRSEYVARTIDVGKLENGTPYIVMEYLEGLDLSQRIAEAGPLSVADAVRFTVQACDALAEAHALGIVHRDLKPSNLFIARRRDGKESTKLLDFGISKLSAAGGTGSDLAMTKTTSVMGSPLYMSPEQLMAAKNADPRSDIWALGVTLHEALAGTPPFTGESLPELCTRVMTQPAPPLGLLRADVPPQLEAIVLRCLSKDPAQRYSSVAELAAALIPFAPASITGIGQGALAAVTRAATLGLQSGVGAVTAPAPNDPTVNSWGRTHDRALDGDAVEIPKHAFWKPILTVVAGLLVVVGGLFVWKFRLVVASHADTSAAATGQRPDKNQDQNQAQTGQSNAAANSARSPLVAAAPTDASPPGSVASAGNQPSVIAISPVSAAPAAGTAVTKNQPITKPLGPNERRTIAPVARNPRTPRVEPGGKNDIFGDRN